MPDGYVPWTSFNGSETNTYQPDWRTAVSEEDEEWEVTEVHLVGEVGLSFSSSDCMEKYKETKDERYSKLSDTRLLIRTNKETKETDGFIMIVYPDLPYLEAHLNQPLRNFSYLKRNDIAFGGVIHYHTLDGSYLNGWLYREGLPYAFNLDQAMESRSADELRAYQVCDYVCEYTDHYTDWYVNGEYSWTQWNGSSEECYYTNCQYEYNSGGSSGGGSPTPGSNSPISKIALDNNLNVEDTETLNDMLDNIKKDCLGKALFNVMNSLALMSDVEFTIEFDNKTSSSVSTGFNSNGVPKVFNITYGRNSNGSGSLLHEFFHVYQNYSPQNPIPYSDSYEKKDNMGLEIEARYAHYTYLTRNPSDTESSGWYEEDANYSIMDLDRYLDDQGNLLPGQSEVELNKFITTNPLGPKLVLHAAYNKGYANLEMSTMTVGSRNFTNLQEISKGC